MRSGKWTMCGGLWYRKDWPGVEIVGAVWAAKVGTDGGNAGTSNRVVDGAVGKM